MILKYKIVEINPDEHSIVVRYYTDTITEESLAVQHSDSGEIIRCRTDFNINLPHPAPSDEELNKLIISSAPTKWFNIQEMVLDPNIDTSLSVIAAKLGVENSFIPAVIQENISPTWTLESVTL